MKLCNEKGGIGLETVTLNNGIEMPVEGFGGWFGTGKEKQQRCEEAVTTALELGFRLIDTAQAYGTEKTIGKVIAQSGIPREELFVTLKLWITNTGYRKTKRAFFDSLANLGLDYLDLYIIHEPLGDYMGSWRALEDLYKEGRIRAIGVSNFYERHLTDLIAKSEIKPAVDQIEINPFKQQQKMRQVLLANNIEVEAWGPLTQGKQDLFHDPTLTMIAQEHDRSVVQIILRWLAQNSIVSIPKSTSKKHIQANLDIFDFELTTDELVQISSLDQQKELADKNKLSQLISTIFNQT